MRTGKNNNSEGFDLLDILKLFSEIYDELRSDGYFDEYFGGYCIDAGHMDGIIASPERDILLKVRKKYLWPIKDNFCNYNEDDLFDIIEYLFTTVSKPIDGTLHSYNQCGMHWETFSKNEGEKVFFDKINALLNLYKEPFELSQSGEILRRPEKGFELILQADTPTDDQNIRTRIDSAIAKYRRHGSTLDDRRQAVRDLADVLEYLRPQMDGVIHKKDESDLFNIANNFSIRHHNKQQKADYDANLWLSWMFYINLSTIHLILRKLNHDGKKAVS